MGYAPPDGIEVCHAGERTFLAYVRTGVAVIAFGFVLRSSTSFS